MRSLAVVLAAAACLSVPLAAPAAALTTTSTVVVYTADPGGDGVHEVYSMPADGSATGTQLFATTTDLADPALSFDGTKLAYVDDTAANGTSHLMVRTADGLGSATQLGTSGDDSEPAWSRDGTTIAFTRHNATTGKDDVYTVPADGSAAPHVVATNAAEPSFAPSGRQLVVDRFSATGGHAGLDLVTLGSGARTHVNGSFTGNDATFAPDGEWLVYELGYVSQGCMIVLARVRPEGSAAAYPEWYLDRTDTFYRDPEFSRDGSELYASVEGFPCDAYKEPAQVTVTTWKDAGFSGSADTTSVRSQYTLAQTSPTVAGGTPQADAAAPAVPVVSATIGAGTVGLSWTGAEDATEFVVLRKPRGATPPTSLSDGTVVADSAARGKPVTGLVKDAAYDFYVFALDASGNASAYARRPARASGPPVLQPIPRVGVATPRSTFVASFTGTTYLKPQVLLGERVRASNGTWSAAPVWRVPAGAVSQTAFAYPGAQGHTYFVKVRGHDAYGNWTAYSATQVANVPLNENAAGVTYSAGWTPVSASDRYAGTYRAATTVGRTMTATADTSSFTLIGDRCAMCGSFRVYVDGVLRATVSAYATTTKVRQVLYAGGSLGAIRSHTIRVVTLGTAGHPRVDLDGIGLTR
jgi:hypothetical protein